MCECMCVCERETERADLGGKWRRGWVGILASRVVVFSCDYLDGLHPVYLLLMLCMKRVI